MFDLQRAGLGKRIAAFLLDVILFSVLATGIGFVISSVTGYSERSAALSEIYAKYESEYGVSFNITADEYAAMDDAARDNYKKAVDAFGADAEAEAIYRSLASLILLITGGSLLLSFLALEFVVPTVIGNGQTVGKKIFGIGVINPDGIRMSRFQTFTRAILGKYTVETMIPALLIILYVFSGLNFLLLLLLLGGIGLLQLILVLSTANRTPIHDLIAGTVAVDLESQLIFANEEEKKKFEDGSGTSDFGGTGGTGNSD